MRGKLIRKEKGYMGQIFEIEMVIEEYLGER